MKRIFNFKAKAGLAMVIASAVLALGVVPVTAEFDVAPDSVEFERISVQSEQVLIQSGFLDKTNYGFCGGWACWIPAQCGTCFCKKPSYFKPGECVG